MKTQTRQQRGLTGGAEKRMLLLARTSPEYTIPLSMSSQAQVPIIAAAPTGSRAEREIGAGQRTKQPSAVWLPPCGKAAPDGLDQRAGGHRERIAEGKNQSYVGSITAEPLFHGGTGASCPRLTTLLRESV
jgi:hypothetical protein